jgi:pimeloyl-ACP methyl ester carboxylesterase
MDQLAVWLAIGGVAVLAMMLVAVLIARGLDGGQAKPAAPATAKSTHGKAPGHAAVKMLLGAEAATKIAEAQNAAKANASAHKGGAVVASIIAALVAGGVATAVVRKVMERNAPPPVPVEIAAGELRGTLLSAGRSKPVVLIVPGSGPTDRDGNNPMGVKAGSYKLLAEALAAEGISTVRVDKRGMFGSSGAGDPNAVSVELYADDYRAWIDAIRAETGRKCVWLLGHSEGALMVSAAAEGRRDVCGLILVAGMGRKLGDVLRSQLEANPANAPLLDQAFAAIADLEAGRRTDTSNLHPALMQLFAPQVQDFLISMMAADPVDLVRRANVQTLIVQGTADLQVTLEDSRLLDKAPRTRHRTITGMNHILKDAPGDRAANLATYAAPELPLHPRLAAVIEDFIERDD